MEEFERSSRKDKQELAGILRRLVRRMTRQEWASPRLMQMDVGQAIAVLTRVDFPKRGLLSRALADLIRELGSKRPDLYRYVIVVEESAADLERELEEPHWL